MRDSVRLDELRDPANFRWENKEFQAKLGRAGNYLNRDLTITGHSSTHHLELYEQRSPRRGTRVGEGFVKVLHPPEGSDALYAAQRSPAALLDRQVGNLKRIHELTSRRSAELYGMSVAGNPLDVYAFVTNWVSGSSVRSRLANVTDESKKLAILYEAVRIIADFNGILERNRDRLNGVNGNGRLQRDVSESVDHIRQILSYEHRETDWVSGPDVLDSIRKEFRLKQSLRSIVDEITQNEAGLFVAGFAHKRHRDMRAHHLVDQKVLDYEEVGDDKYWQDVASLFTAEGRIALPDFSELPRIAAWYKVHYQASLENRFDQLGYLDPDDAERMVPEAERYQATLEILGILLKQELHIDAHNKRHDKDRRDKLRDGLRRIWSEGMMLAARQENIAAIIDYVAEEKLHQRGVTPEAAGAFFQGWGKQLRKVNLVNVDARTLHRLRS